ncbi:MAG: alpha/beta hydrolase [Candidatus Competibacteraceae bacterium]|nr:alpha/beta hydrolase [Candidatus Competibacteraceae bacterium]
MLENYGFEGRRLNLIGHSWGTYVAAKLGEKLPWSSGSSVKQVLSIIALDPANSPPVWVPILGDVPGAMDYNPEDEANFSQSAVVSWAFRSSTLAGDEETPGTATESFAVYPLQASAAHNHDAIKKIFTDILNNPTNELAAHFTLTRLLSGTPGPWKTDRYRWDAADSDDETDWWKNLSNFDVVGRDMFEGTIVAVESGEQPWFLHYYDNSTNDEIVKYRFYGPFAINTTASNGSVTKNPNQSTYDIGTAVALTATPDSGYQFTGWSGDASGTQNPLSVTMNIDKNITANFAPIAQNYTISLSASPSGGGTASGGGGYPAGSSRTVTASANSGYTFANWTENGSVVSTSSSYTFTLNSNRTLVANFVLLSYTVTRQPGRMERYRQARHSQ